MLIQKITFQICLMQYICWQKDHQKFPGKMCMLHRQKLPSIKMFSTKFYTSRTVLHLHSEQTKVTALLITLDQVCFSRSHIWRCGSSELPRTSNIHHPFIQQVLVERTYYDPGTVLSSRVKILNKETKSLPL